MKHYHVLVSKNGVVGSHSVSTLSAALRILTRYHGWADWTERTTCHRRVCHPLRINGPAKEA